LNFVLVPFPATASLDHMNGDISGRIDGTIQRSGNQLIVGFRTLSRLGIRWPEAGTPPERRSGLWEFTCFECFIGLGDADTYIETNLSPAGHWQAFEFEAYRDVAVPSQTVRVAGQSVIDTTMNTSSNNQYRINCTIDIEHPRFVTSDWHIAPTTVLEDLEGQLHYYALSHSGGRPDFHLAATRTLVLPLSD